MGEGKREYQFGTVEDILRECGVEPTEQDRKMEMDGGILLTSGIHVYLHAMRSMCMRDFSAIWKGRLVPQRMLTVIYDRADKEYLYDVEENFVDTVHEWLDGQCTQEQLEQAMQEG